MKKIEKTAVSVTQKISIVIEGKTFELTKEEATKLHDGLRAALNIPTPIYCPTPIVTERVVYVDRPVYPRPHITPYYHKPDFYCTKTTDLQSQMVGSTQAFQQALSANSGQSASGIFNLTDSIR